MPSQHTIDPVTNEHRLTAIETAIAYTERALDHQAVEYARRLEEQAAGWAREREHWEAVSKTLSTASGSSQGSKGTWSLVGQYVGWILAVIALLLNVMR